MDSYLTALLVLIEGDIKSGNILRYPFFETDHFGALNYRKYLSKRCSLTLRLTARLLLLQKVTNVSDR